MPLYQNQTQKAIITDVSSQGGVIDHAPQGMRTIAPNEIVAGGFHLNKVQGLVKLTGAEQLGDVIASNVVNIPFGRLTRKSGSVIYEFSKHCHLIHHSSMAANNFELFNKATSCLVVDDTGEHTFQYMAYVIPNTLAIV